MSAGLPFSALGNNASIAGTTGSANATLPGAADSGDTISVYNSAAAVAFVRWGKGAQTAISTDQFVGPGATRVFGLPSGCDNVAAILASGTGNVYFQRGSGGV